MVSTGQNPARACERLPIIAIRQLGQSTASPAVTKKMTPPLRRTVCLLGTPSVWPADETILRSRRNRPETEVCSNGIGQTTGCDHVGNHHQPILPPVLQGRAGRHSKAASYLGLIVATRSVHPAPVEYDCEQAGPPFPRQKTKPAPEHIRGRLSFGKRARSRLAFCLEPDTEASHH